MQSFQLVSLVQNIFSEAKNKMTNHCHMQQLVDETVYKINRYLNNLSI